MKKINLNTVKEKLVEIKETVNPIARIKSIEIVDLKETPFNGMISSAFWMAGKLPVAGKTATKVFEKSGFEEKSKNFANKFFNPFYYSNKVTTALSK